MRPLNPRAVTRAAEVLGVAALAAPFRSRRTVTGAIGILAGGGDLRHFVRAHAEHARYRARHGLHDCARVSAFVAYVLWCALTGRVLP